MADMKELGVWEPLAVKLQTYKTAVEVRREEGGEEEEEGGGECLLCLLEQGTSLLGAWMSAGRAAQHSAAQLCSAFNFSPA